MLEKDGVVTTADRRFIWNGSQIVEERDASNAVQKRFYGMGVQQVAGAQAGNYYYQRDHLGSVRSVLNSSGVEVAKYDFDLWGSRTKVSGTFDVDMGYTGHFQHEASGLALTWFRAYDPKMGRWLSRDPIGEMAGLNLYAYVSNTPANFVDPHGLKACQVNVGFHLAPWLLPGFGISFGPVVYTEPFDVGLAVAGQLYPPFTTAELSVGVAGAYNKGGRSDFEGPAAVLNVSTIYGGAGVAKGAGSPTWEVSPLGVGVGYSYGVGYTGSLTVRDIVNWVKSFFSDNSNTSASLANEGCQ
jgi:RHS repeat-associated protein